MENKVISFKYKATIKESIDSFLKRLNYSDNNIYYIIKNGNVKVNGNTITDKNSIINKDDEIIVILVDEDNTLPITNNELEIVYEDEYILIVNKPYGLEVEPSKNNYENTLANYVGYYYKENQIHSKIHLVNRLDRLTSGLVIFAKNRYIHNLFKNVNIIKKYEALVEGKVDLSGTIEIRIKKENDSVKRIESSSGKLAKTEYNLIKYDGINSLVNINLLTGKTHQIRLSFKSIGHPLVNDPLYNEKEVEGNMYLKANYLCFNHPITNIKIELYI